MATFGERLRLLRRERDLGQKEVASWCGLTLSAIGKYEHGERTPSPDVVKKLAENFGVSTDYLLGQTDIRSHLLGTLDDDSALAQMARDITAVKNRLLVPNQNLEQLTLLQQAYENAPPEIQAAVDAVLTPYRQKEKEKGA